MKKLLVRLRELRAQGRTRIRIVGIDLKELAVVTIMDASFANEVGRKSQFGFFNVATTDAVSLTEVLCTIIEFESKTISRVVRSTMAAESASLSTALDRHLFLRLLFETLLYGQPDLVRNWRMHLKIPGVLVTDAKSLYCLLYTSPSPRDRQKSRMPSSA